MNRDVTLFLNAGAVVTAAGPARARRGNEMSDAAVRTGVGVAVRGERIEAVDTDEGLVARYPGATIHDCAGGVITPGLVDSHTHAVFGAPRFAEHELRATGVPYMEIARRGGGIHSSVRDLRSRSDDELTELTIARLQRVMASGTTTVEIKSGYGLSLDDELRTLRIIRRVANAVPCRIVPTFLGAHEIPLEFRERPNGRAEYIRLVCNEMIPAVGNERLAVFADVFCEPGVYALSETRRILQAAMAHGMRAKLHADELEDGAAAELAAEIAATSADHLAAISASGIAALATSRTVATLLPATMLFLGRPKQAPARALIEAGAAVALATDFNPGTSPLTNIGIVLTLAVSQLHLRVEEALIAVTVNGAAALELAEHVGQISPGFSADLALWDVTDFREISYWFGERLCRASWVRGKPCHHW